MNRRRTTWITGLTLTLLTTGASSALANQWDRDRPGKARPAFTAQHRFDERPRNLRRANSELKRKLKAALEREHRLERRLEEATRNDARDRRRIVDLKRGLENANARATTAESRLNRAKDRVRRAEQDRERALDRVASLQKRTQRLKQKLRQCRFGDRPTRRSNRDPSGWNLNDTWEGSGTGARWSN